MMKLFRTVLIGAVAFGCVAAGSIFLLGRLTFFYPALDLINNFLPFIGFGCLVLLALSLALRSRVLIGVNVALTAAVLAPIVLSLPSAAKQAPDGAPRLLRVVTFNLEVDNTHLRKITDFLAKTKADVVLLQEFRDRHTPLLKTLARQFPYRADARGLAILSTHPIIKSGHVNRQGRPGALICWARIAVNGKQVELANVHVWLPFNPDLQRADLATLTAYVKSRTGPLIVGGDFNATPWTHRLQQFTHATKLQRFNTVHPTWPGRPNGAPPFFPRLPLRFPVLPIDNVFASAHFAKIAISAGSWLGSDHRPVIADIALIE